MVGEKGGLEEKMNSVIEYLAFFSKSQPQKTAVVVQGKSYSYLEFYQSICGFSDFFGFFGVNRIRGRAISVITSRFHLEKNQLTEAKSYYIDFSQATAVVSRKDSVTAFS